MSARGGGVTYRVEWAPGIEPAESEFRPAAAGAGAANGRLATIDLRAVRAALDARPGGGAANDPTAPAEGPGRHGPQRARLHRPRPRHRRRRHPRRGPQGAVRLPRRDARARLAALAGRRRRGLPAPLGRRRRQPARRRAGRVQRHAARRCAPTARPARLPRPHPPAAPPCTPARRVYSRVEAPLEPLRTPAIGDIDGDRRAEIVDTAGEHVYAWELDGTPVAGFPVRLNPDFSRPQDRTRENHVKRGFFAAPVLADLTGGPALEIVATAMDQHVYAFDGGGAAVPGWPVKLRDPSLPGAEIITAPAVGDITGDGRPELVTPTQEFDDAAAAPEGDLVSLLRSGVTNVLANAAGGSGRTYALDAGGARAARAGPSSPTAPCPTRCRSSAPASSTRWPTPTPTRSSR